MECLLPYLCIVTVPHIMVGLERMLDYRGVGLARFHYMMTIISYITVESFVAKNTISTYVYRSCHELQLQATTNSRKNFPIKFLFHFIKFNSNTHTHTIHSCWPKRYILPVHSPQKMKKKINNACLSNCCHQFGCSLWRQQPL